VTPAPILFYDGECGLCTKSVQWCLAHDRKKTLLFAPLLGSTYRSVETAIRQSLPSDVSSAIYYDGARVYLKSDATLRAVRSLGGPWALLAAAGLLVPRVLRDMVYSYVAKRRIAWFGTADACSVPAPSERGRFLP
jgi:predicted DCC family thiol-disulfide oxidoreductase YuxK